MWNLTLRSLFRCSRADVYYPFFLASDYTPLEYSHYYVHQEKHRNNRQTNLLSIRPISIKFAILLFQPSLLLS
jgi:hypothetical protein